MDHKSKKCSRKKSSRGYNVDDVSTSTSTSVSAHDNIIAFWKETERPYGMFCNFAKTEIVLEDGTIVDCSEKAFMLKKLERFDPDNKEARHGIIGASKPIDAKNWGRKIRNFDEAVWDAERYNVMRNVLLLKFGQNPDAKHLLLSTGKHEFVEASPYDTIWGVGLTAEQVHAGVPYRGQNLLGKALMEVRAHFQEQKQEQ